MRSSTRPLLLLIVVLCVSDVAVGSFFKQVHNFCLTSFDFKFAVMTFQSDPSRNCVDIAVVDLCVHEI